MSNNAASRCANTRVREVTRHEQLQLASCLRVEGIGDIVIRARASIHWSYLGLLVLTSLSAQLFAQEASVVPRLVAQLGHSPDSDPCVALSPDGSQALTGGSDGIAILWDAGSGREIRRF